MKNIKFTSLVLLLLAVCFASVSARAPKSRWATSNAGKLHYYDVGSSNKKALIFVHGWTCNADFWKDSYSAFPEYRVIAIDLPGQGQSEKPQATYSMEYMAQAIESVMKAAGIRQAVLVGHSMGTPVIRQFYRLYPDQTLGLVIVDGALRPFGPKAQMDVFFAPLKANYKDNGPKFVDGLLGPTRADLKPAIRSAMLATPDYVAIGAMDGMLDEKIWTNDKINVPVLAVMNANGQWPADNADYYRSVAPKIDYEAWTGVSHFLMMEKPKEFNDLVRSFIKTNKLL